MSPIGDATFSSSAASGAPGAASVGSATSAGAGGDAQFTATGTGVDPATVRQATSGPDLRGQAPSVSVESEVSQAAGQDGSAVLRGGGAGVIERETGGVSESSVKTEATAAARHENLEARNAAGVAGDATSFRDPASEVARAENLEFHQRDQAVARARAAEDANDQARRIADNPTAVGAERAQGIASQKIGDATPAARVEANVNLATGAVENPRGAAQGQADAAVSAQERDAEAKLGIRGSAGPSREEVTGRPPTDDDKK